MSLSEEMALPSEAPRRSRVPGGFLGSFLRILEGAFFGANFALALYPLGFNPSLVVGAALYGVSLLLRHLAYRWPARRELLLRDHAVIAAVAWFLVVLNVPFNA